MGTYIDKAFKEAADTVASTGGRARYLLLQGWDISKVVQELRLSVLDTPGIGQFIVTDDEFDAIRDGNKNRKKPAKLTTVVGAFKKADGMLFKFLETVRPTPDEFNTRLTHSSPQKLEGVHAPTMIRRNHCPLPSRTTEAMQLLSDVPLRIDQTMLHEWVLPYRESLRKYVVKKWDACGADRSQDQFLYEKYKEEALKVGSDLICTLAKRGDGQARIYEEAFSHMFNHAIRNFLRHGVPVPISKDSQAEKTAFLQRKWHVSHWGEHVKHVLGNPVGYSLSLRRPGKLVDQEMGDVYAWLHSEVTGEDDWMFELDGVSSVVQHAALSAGLLDELNLYCNVKNPDQVHPKRQLTAQASESPKGRSVIGHLSMPEKEVLGAMAMSPLGYGGTERAVVSGWTDSFWDGDTWRKEWAADKAKTPYVPKPLREWIATQVGDPWDAGDIVEALTEHAKVWVAAFKTTFPWMHAQNAAMKKEWKDSWDQNSRPPVQHRAGGWVYTPPLWKQDKHKYWRTNEASWTCPETGKEYKTTQRQIHAMRENSAKSTAPALKRQSDDSHTCAGTVLEYFDVVSCPSMKTTHDAHRCRWRDRFILQDIYRRQIGETHGVTIPEGWCLLG
jgi:transposase